MSKTLPPDPDEWDGMTAWDRCQQIEKHWHDVSTALYEAPELPGNFVVIRSLAKDVSFLAACTKWLLERVP